MKLNAFYPDAVVEREGEYYRPYRGRKSLAHADSVVELAG